MKYKLGRCQLPKLRKSRGLTQQQLGDLVGMSRKRISDYERDRRSMSLETAILISGALGCDVKELYELVEVDN